MNLTRTQQVLVGIAIVCIVGALAAGLYGRYAKATPSETDGTYTPPPAEPIPATITVHVAGAVRRPGLYELPRGSRVTHAVQAAGGATLDADMDRTNLAAPIEDGQRIDIPSRIRGPVREPVPDSPASGQLININAAGVEELQRLPGIGPVLARAIVEHRQRNGAFRSVDDLAAVPGIGPKRLSEMRPHVAVQ